MIMIPNKVEEGARRLVAVLFLYEGCMVVDIDDAKSEIRRYVAVLIEGLSELEGPIPPDAEETLKAAEARAIAIVDEIADDQALLMTEYLDVLPEDSRKRLLEITIDTLREAGTHAEVRKDEEGNTFIALSNVEAAGIDPADAQKLADECPAPVGPLRRLH